ncbi:G-type lectin S-receptor-like serine/threonine-protein kinase At2g19130 [Salvia hispanica]|uniref:G-type lectin S-receptor-like serine/threonine-protein kinase At2g19130 n=1 Tax=Salvia hispanica TaxID=49212 RepID=UPI00200991B9|nr:G-type lectin S-receptor-like serine/threonine-protein kinase At2g19130 [Salvia hispanica]
MVLRSHGCTTIHLILLYFCINAFTSFANDTISGNQTLSGDQTIVSAGDKFVLGFFKPGKAPRHYIGIWFKKVQNQTVVWVANREIPVSDPNTAKLLISGGNLVLLNELGSEIWSTAVNSTSAVNSSLAAVLGDDGNLVLSNGTGSNPRSGQVLWQSFDHPVHTWLPGGKIAYDKITKKKQLLTSWKNEEDPAMGLFSLELDPDGSQYLIKWNRSVEYWTSGPWNGHIFSKVPEMRLTSYFDFSYENNTNESYFTYSMHNPAVISRFIMDVSGQIKQQTILDENDWNLFWTQPREQCQVHDYCGAFGSCQNVLPSCSCLPGFRIRNLSDWDLKDYSGGCVRDVSLQCNGSNGRGDSFWPVTNVGLPVNEDLLTVGSVGECESSCFNDCSCTAYAYDEGRGCSVWKGDLVNLQQLNEGDGNGKVIHIRLSASSSVFSGSKNSKGSMIGVVAGCVGGALVVVAVVVGLIWRRRKRAVGSSKAVEGSLAVFAYKDLQNATKNFSDKLGGGGFGSVFKGTLPDSTVIAAKKLESITQGEKQFRTEVSTIGTIQHVNLVRLRGFCSEGSKKLLVYDYMENGSLDSHLFHANEIKFLDWKTRYQIALGIARGLSYLHEKCRDCIIHCDIKPENILLDPEFCPKVADFGLAKLVGRDFSRVLTTMRGTRGYLAPEWISGVAITAKADVYSYGMMLFELVSGRRNSESSEDGTVKFFPSWAANAAVNGGDLLSLLDPVLDRNADAEQVLKICKIACWCIQDDEDARPSMGQVVQILEGVMDVNPPPIPRSLQVFVETQEHIVFFTDSSTDQSSQAKSNASSSASSNSMNSSVLSATG